MRQQNTTSAEYHCAYCGERNRTFVDPSQGDTQTYIEDCQVCCRPNKLSVSYDKWNEKFIIQSRQSQ
ncbi:Cysteine-rich CPXCG [Fodinibius salinus]|uniref:Cysteine-rich CPXCG n=1 Tax=Fodinibius salinus TaxID=860790 RepID=A0A5D3YHE2_9BACT|nr:CPXCG motif-containing cysteine-rich protein [Fodinibius salinus]TYP93324.1 Cysteine-rich CPXCG [Fodinibius salinus]